MLTWHQATIEEIRSAYKKLAVTYHPDVHNREADPSTLVSFLVSRSGGIMQALMHFLQAAAKETFTLIKSAYETLSDEQKRTIYDMYGIQGLQSGWELGQKFKTPEEAQTRNTRRQLLCSLFLLSSSLRVCTDAERV